MSQSNTQTQAEWRPNGEDEEDGKRWFCTSLNRPARRKVSGLGGGWRCVDSGAGCAYCDRAMATVLEEVR